MRKGKAHAQSENIHLLMEIYNLKMILRHLNIQKGSANSDYITLSLKLDLLMKEYIDEKLLNLLTNSNSKSEMKKSLNHNESTATKRGGDYLIHSNSTPYQYFTYYGRKR